jgi:hypothetical protein
MSETVRPSKTLGIEIISEGLYLFELGSVSFKKKDSGVWSVMIPMKVADAGSDVEYIGFPHTEFRDLDPERKSWINKAVGFFMTAGVIPEDKAKELPFTCFESEALRDEIEKKAPGMKIGGDVIHNTYFSNKEQKQVTKPKIQDFYSESEFRAKASNGSSPTTTVTEAPTTGQGIKR